MFNLCKDKPLDLHRFWTEIVTVYRLKYSTQQRGTICPPQKITLFKGRSNENRVATAVRFDGIRHYPGNNPTQSRCGCYGTKSKYACTKCDVAYIKCF